MNIQCDLVALYEEWRVLSEEEAHAINFAAWSQVDQCQDAKRELQDKIIQAADMLQKDARCQSLDQKQIAGEVRERLTHLIALELRNQELLNTQRGKAQKQKEFWINLNKTCARCTGHTCPRATRSGIPIHDP